MIERDIAPVLRERFRQYPFVTVTGPRQSGKTTLCRGVFPELAYANLEDPSQRSLAEADPRGWIGLLGDGAIIDEIQHVPELLSYLQVIADDAGRNGMYVLTGSEQFQLTESVTQSLAGRTALLQLLPLSLAERRRIGASDEIDDALFAGGYPRLLDQGLHPAEALADYVESYVERDVRRLGNVRQLSTFRRFMRLCAGRIGQLLNLNSLASDAGIRQSTAQEWFGILEASFITHRLEPYWSNLRKRLVKTSKLYFYDTGLACFLLGISDPHQLATHPLRGSLFENLVVSELIKSRYNRGQRPSLSFYRDSNGLECDVFDRHGGAITAIEIKAGATLNRDYFGPIQRVTKHVPEIARSIVIYAGDTRQIRHNVEVVPFRELADELAPVDVEADVDEFIRRYSSPAREDRLVEALEACFQGQIRPLIAAVDELVQPFGEALFAHVSAHGVIRTPTGESSGPPITDPDAWRTVQDQWQDTLGGSPEGAEFQLSQFWTLSSYTGRGAAGFDLPIVIRWTFDADGVSTSVQLDDQPLSELERRDAYGELAARAPSPDRLIADLTKALMGRIAERSGAS